MEARHKEEFNPPHDRPDKLVHRYFEELMRLTYEHPVLMRDVIKVVGVSSLALLSAPWWSQLLGANFSTAASVAAVGAGAIGAAASGISWFAQNNFYGLPVKDDHQVYHEDEFSWQSAHAKLYVKEGEMPRLKIEAQRSYDAGYVEGFILGEAIRNNLTRTGFLYKPMWLMGAPWSSANISKYIEAVYAMLPGDYQDEVRGKVAGYNDWLSVNAPGSKELTVEYYLLLHMLPDIRNYNPFRKPGKDHSVSEPVLPHMGCTTAVLRLGDYTIFTRVLDWPSYGDCSPYFLQLDRKIGDGKRTIDIGIPLLSGALTILNEDGMLVEMNVAHGDKVDEPNGMPAVFFNRYCAEQAANITELDGVIANQSPLGAYHLTASDGRSTKSYHFYQHHQEQGEHGIDELGHEKEPQLLVVANHGLEYVDTAPVVVNHRDSDQRKANIHHFFSQKSAQDKFQQYIKKQDGGERLSSDDLLDIKEFCLQLARLPLVCNCASVLCALYVYHHDQLIDASVATDNLYAQRKELDQFKRLTMM